MCKCSVPNINKKAISQPGFLLVLTIFIRKDCSPTQFDPNNAMILNANLQMYSKLYCSQIKIKH